jgi:hypothetical protein
LQSTDGCQLVPIIIWLPTSAAAVPVAGNGLDNDCSQGATCRIAVVGPDFGHLLNVQLHWIALCCKLHFVVIHHAGHMFCKHRASLLLSAVT